MENKVICPYCNKEATYAPNEEWYGKRYGKSYMAYFCRPCDAYVGTHNNTTQPLGTMANKELRNARMKAHAVIDPLWRSGKMKRGQLYAKLNRHFGKHVHIGESDLKLCDEIIQFAATL